MGISTIPLGLLGQVGREILDEEYGLVRAT